MTLDQRLKHLEANIGIGKVREHYLVIHTINGESEEEAQERYCKQNNTNIEPEDELIRVFVVAHMPGAKAS